MYIRLPYDALGRLLTVQDDNGQPGPDYDFSKVEYTYDWDDTNKTVRTVQEAQTLGTDGTWSVVSTYDQIGRRTILEYPNAREITFTYDALGRLFQIEENGSDLAYHEYVGHYPGRIFIGGDPFEPEDLLRLSMANYQNFTGYRDAWGRVTQIDYRRRDDGMQAIKDFDYSYDYASNIIYQEDHSAAALDELYSYDTLHRLTGFERGDLNGNKDAIIAPAAREQAWTLDNLGNWIGIEADDTPPPAASTTWPTRSNHSAWRRTSSCASSTTPPAISPTSPTRRRPAATPAAA